ncbi:MAG: ATP-binding protein [Gemmatirosa sp.]
MSQPDLLRHDSSASPASAASSPVGAPGDAHIAQGPDSGFRLMAELMPQLVWTTTADGYHDWFNERWHAYTGMPRPDEPGGEHEASQGWSWEDYLHPDDLARTQAAWEHALATGDDYATEYRFRNRATGGYGWFLARAVAVRDASGAIVRWFGTCTDIDDAKQNELALEVLADAGAAMAGATDTDAALDALARTVVPRLADWCAVDLADDAPDARASGRRVAVAHVEPAKVALAHELAERYPPSDDAQATGVPHVLRTGRPQLVAEIPDAMLAASARDEEHLRLMRALGLTSAIVVPIVVDGRTLGAISLVSAEGRRRYTARDVAHAEELARYAALAMERTRLVGALQRERERLLEHSHALAARNEALQQQAVELEMQAAQLQEQAAELEAQAEDLHVSNAALGASEIRFRSLFQSMTQGVVYQDADGRITDANPAAERVLGLSLAQLTGAATADPAWRATDAAGVPLATDQFPARRALAAGEVRLGERIAIQNPVLGEQRWLSVDAVPERRPGEERPFRVYSLFSDVTEEVRAAEMRLRLAEAERAARQQMARVFEQAPVAISVTHGPAHVYEQANAAMRRLTGDRDLIGRSAHDALGDLDARLREAYDRVYATGEAYVGTEMPVSLPREADAPAAQAYVNLVHQPLRDATGAVSGIVTVATDVTDQVLARRAIERARESAEEANMAKSQFLRTVSHELRTPLNAISGYADLVLMELRGPVTTEQRADVERIKRASQHLLGLINDILSFAKLEAGQVELDVGLVDLPPTLGEVEALVGPQLAAKALRYTSDVRVPDLAVRADAERLRQILLNLLGNAIKFTPEGGRIAVTCDADATRVVIHVRDTGVGIPRDALERIFDPFVQVGRNLRAPSDGVGLGLAISRDLARRMGGDLTADSRVGEGSTFTLLLPRAGMV